MSEWSKMMSRRRRYKHRVRQAARWVIILFIVVAIGVIVFSEPKVSGESATKPIEILPLEEVEKAVIEDNEFSVEVLELDTTEAKEEKKIYYYEIPEEYKKADLTRELQEYLYDECQKRGIDYSIALALIEKESGYYSKCMGDDGNSKGYMQIYQKWHSEEMQAEGVSDLFDSKGNIRVGLDILQGLYEKYGNSGDHCVLMVYNMGYSAKKLWAKGVYSSEYSRYIMTRAQEIKQDLQE